MVDKKAANHTSTRRVPVMQMGHAHCLTAQKSRAQENSQPGQMKATLEIIIAAARMGIMSDFRSTLKLLPET
jgi:hypothetical protein